MNRIFLSGALLLVLSLQSCKDDYLMDFESVNPPAPGSPVVFGAGLSGSESGSRTVYGERDGDVFPIFWSHPSDTVGSGTYDDISIYSPTGGADGQPGQVRYTVKPPGPNYSGYSPVVPASSENTLVVSESGTQNFYAFYPNSAVEAWSNTTPSVYVTMPSSRTVYVPSKSDKGVYRADNDMNLCYMKAVHSNYQLEEGKPVQLQFKPFSTVLDITIPGPTADGDKCTVTGVTVKSVVEAGTHSLGAYTRFPVKDIAGKFFFNLSTERVTSYVGMGQSGSRGYISVDICDAESKSKGFTLSSGESLNLKVFLVPNSDIQAMDVEVHTSDGVRVKRLSKPSGSSTLLSPGAIHIVRLPAIGSQGAEPDLTQWMSELDDATPIANLSIPGAYDAADYFTYNASDRSKRSMAAQYEDITAQFEAGIRAFHFNLIMTQDPNNPWVVQRPGTTAQTDKMGLGPLSGYGSLGDVLHRLVDVMQARGNSEFCILDLHVNYYITLGSGYDNVAFVYDILSQYVKQLRLAGMLPDKKEGGYTVGDLRGKILLQLKLNGDPKIYESDHWWNYGYVNSSTDSDPNQSSEVSSMISPLSNIQRLLINNPKTAVYSWDTVDGNEFWTTDSELYANATPEVTHTYTPSKWGEYIKDPDTGDCPPMMLTYYTKTNLTRAAVTPVSFGKIGDLNYTPKYDSQEAYDSRTETGEYDSYFDRDTYQAPVYSDYPVPVAQSGKAGLRWLHAYLLWKNMEHVGTGRGMVHNNIYRSTADFRIYNWSDATNNPYVQLKNNVSQTYWLHSYECMDDETSSPVDAYGWRQDINRGMWSSAPEFNSYQEYSGQPMVKVYRSIFGHKLFISTYLGIGQRRNYPTTSNMKYNNLVVESFLGYVCQSYDLDATSSLDLSANWNSTPLGAVYMPYIPDRKTDLSDTSTYKFYDDSQRKAGIYVRKLIDLMIRHSKQLQGPVNN